MDLGLAGRKAAITGSSRGIGHAIALALAAEGCEVALSGRDGQALDRAVGDMGALGVKAIGVRGDLSSEAGCRDFVAAVGDGLGGLDILVNNVGSMIPGTLDSLTAEAWDQVLSANLMSHVHTTKFALAYLKAAEGGRILNVSGVSGRQLLPGSLTTTLPNAAIIGFTKVMAAELAAHGITVNNICPGPTAVESWGPRAEAMAKVRGTTAEAVRQQIGAQTMLGRWADPREIGDVAAFLVSPRNSYMTGTTVEVCGGFTKYL